jgi:acyl dehydratase
MTNSPTSQLLGHGFYFEEMPLGFAFHTKGRTISEADLNAYVNLTWFTEELFVNVHGTSHRSIQGRVVPGGMIFCFAEGLIHPSMEVTGRAFLNTNIDVKRPTRVGDTISVQCTVIEARVTSKGDTGLVRTENRVSNQNGEIVLVYTPQRLVSRAPPKT